MTQSSAAISERICGDVSYIRKQNAVFSDGRPMTLFYIHFKTVQIFEEFRKAGIPDAWSNYIDYYQYYVQMDPYDSEVPEDIHVKLILFDDKITVVSTSLNGSAQKAAKLFPQVLVKQFPKAITDFETAHVGKPIQVNLKWAKPAKTTPNSEDSKTDD